MGRDLELMAFLSIVFRCSTEPALVFGTFISRTCRALLAFSTHSFFLLDISLRKLAFTADARFFSAVSVSRFLAFGGIFVMRVAFFFNSITVVYLGGCRDVLFLLVVLHTGTATALYYLKPRQREGLHKGRDGYAYSYDDGCQGGDHCGCCLVCVKQKYQAD